MKEPHEPAIPAVTCELIPELPFPWNGAFIQWEKDLPQHVSDFLGAAKNREPMEIELADWEDEP